MKKFKTELEGDFIRGTNLFQLEKPLIYDAITADTGFKTNFASIPKIFLWYIDITDPVIRDIAVIHDLLYVTKGLDGIYTRYQADKILREGMRELGADKHKAYLAYLGVRIAGWVHWGDAITE
jgi:hypothetical protein